MTGSSTAERVADRSAPFGREAFLSTYRATAVCQRELARLTEELVEGLTAPVFADAEAPVVRMSPDRCIVQLGPVALTVAWLRGARASIAEGELLVILWRGNVASRGPAHPERPGAARAPSAAVLWEEVLAPLADDEPSWRWRSRRSDTTGDQTSSELAARCLARLHDAYVESGPQAGA